MLPSRSKSLSGPSSSGPKGPVLIEGMLEKKKTFGSNKFFCSLHDGKLWYSEDKGRESIIDISHAQSVREGKARFSFEIITSSRTHTFVADSQPTRDKWVACLREVMRVSSRKNSTLSYIESANSDEETTGVASSSSSNPRSSSGAGQRSSGAGQRSSGVKPPTSPLKPGFGASLPAGLTTRGTTPPSVGPPIKEERTHPGRTTSEMTSLMESVPQSETAESLRAKPSLEPIVIEQETGKGGDGNRMMHGTQDAAAADGARNEIKEDDDDDDDRMHVTLSRDGDEYEAEAFSKGDSGESPVLNRHVDSEAADENDSRTTVASEIVSLSPSSLYANNADIKKFLYEQSMEEEQNAGSVRANTTSEEMKSERKGSDDSASGEPQLQRDPKEKVAMSRGNTEEEDEEADDVFNCHQAEHKERVEEVRPPVLPVLRRSSQPVIPIIVDSVQEEPASVELDVDFCRQPIPNLPHPHLDENWSLAFVEMRSILSTTTDSMAKKENSAALTTAYIFKDQRQQQQGCAVDSLKHFLKNIECG